MSSQCGEIRPTSGLRHPCKFQRVSRLGSVTAATSLNGSQPNFARCLAVSRADILRTHFRGLLPRYGILPGAIFTLHPPCLALSYFGSVTARHLSSGREPSFAALSTGGQLYSAGRPSRWALAPILVMAALCNGGIIFLPCGFFLSIFYLSFFPRLISAATDRMSTILLHMAWP